MFDSTTVESRRILRPFSSFSSSDPLPLLDGKNEEDEGDEKTLETIIRDGSTVKKDIEAETLKSKSAVVE